MRSWVEDAGSCRPGWAGAPEGAGHEFVTGSGLCTRQAQSSGAVSITLSNLVRKQAPHCLLHRPMRD